MLDQPLLLRVVHTIFLPQSTLSAPHSGERKDCEHWKKSAWMGRIWGSMASSSFTHHKLKSAKESFLQVIRSSNGRLALWWEMEKPKNKVEALGRWMAR